MELKKTFVYEIIMAFCKVLIKFFYPSKYIYILTFYSNTKKLLA